MNCITGEFSGYQLPGKKREVEMKDKLTCKLQRTSGTGSSKCVKSVDEVRTRHWLDIFTRSSQASGLPPSLSITGALIHSTLRTKPMKKSDQTFATSMDAGHSEENESGLKQLKSRS